MRGSCLLPDVLGRFYSRYPDVQINLLEESHSVEKQLMLSPNVDFAIYNSTAADPTQTAEYLGQEEIVLVAAPGHPLAEKAMAREGFRYPWVDLRHTEHEPYILHPGTRQRAVYRQDCLKRPALHPRSSCLPATAISPSGWLPPAPPSVWPRNPMSEKYTFAIPLCASP